MKKVKKLAVLFLGCLMLLGLTGCGSSDGKTHLTFQIWDVAQRDGMQAVGRLHGAASRCGHRGTGYKLGRVLDEAGGFRNQQPDAGYFLDAHQRNP